MFGFRPILSIIVLLLVATKSHTQVFQEIRGKVVDQESKIALAGASIQLIGKSMSAVADTAGNFIMLVPVGYSYFRISYTGYEEVILPAIEVMKSKELFLNIELRENIPLKSLQEVIIKTGLNRSAPINSMAAVSARIINAEDAKRYAAGYGDPARMISPFAGVVTVGGEDNDIVIRGNSPRGLQWKLDGLDIPSPNHFPNGEGGSGGSFSMISAEIIANSDFFTGAFPAEYGNALSGIMDLNMRNGSSTKTLYSFQVGVAGLEAGLEGPINKRNGSSWLLNYRYANFQPLNKLKLLGLADNQKPPIFQDLAFKINLPTKKSGTFALFAIAGYSTTGVAGVRDSLQWSANYGLKNDETEDHRMAVLGLEHSFSFADKKSFLKSIIAFTYDQNKADDGIILSKEDSANFPGVIIPNGYIRFMTHEDQFNYPSLKFSSSLNHKISSHHIIRAGFMVSWLGYKVKEISYNREGSASLQQLIYDTLANDHGNSLLAEIYAQWKFRINNSLEMNTGIHGTYFRLNSHGSIEPRWGLKWQITKKSSLSYGLGIHSRLEPISTYFTLIEETNGVRGHANKSLDLAKAFHMVIGYRLAVTNNLRLRLEAYYQYLYNVPVNASPQSSESILNLQYGRPDTTYINSGKGYNKGLELTLEKEYSNSYYFLITGSLFDSKYRGNNRQLYNTYFNTNFVANIVAGKDFPSGKNKQNLLGINARMVLRGGFRYTGQSLGPGGIFYTDPFAEQTPAFSSFDFGIRFRKNKANLSWIISLDIQNVFNKENILYYTPQYLGGTTIFLEPSFGLGIIPILNFRVQF